MSHAVTTPNEPIELGLSLSDGWRPRVHQVPAASDNLCWLIEYREGEVAVVDGPGATELKAYLSLHGLRLTHLLNTHTHGDHIGVNRALERAGELEGLEVWGSALAPSPIPGLTRALREGERFKLGELEGLVWLTEGHLNGHISLIIGSPSEALALFCGDTLFCAGCGYVFDGPMSVMAESLDRLSALTPSCLVFCAHEYTLDNLHFALSLEPSSEALRARVHQARSLRAEGRSTVPSRLAEELATNPFLRFESPELRAAIGAEPGASRAAIFELTRRLKDSKRYRERALEELL